MGSHTAQDSYVSSVTEPATKIPPGNRPKNWPTPSMNSENKESLDVKRELIEVVCDGCGRREVYPKGKMRCPFVSTLHNGEEKDFCSIACFEQTVSGISPVDYSKYSMKPSEFRNLPLSVRRRILEQQADTLLESNPNYPDDFVQ